jgi:hypothetical protein
MYLLRRNGAKQRACVAQMVALPNAKQNRSLAVIGVGVGVAVHPISSVPNRIASIFLVMRLARRESRNLVNLVLLLDQKT